MQEILKIVERSLGYFDNTCCSAAICRLGTLIGVNAANSHILGDKRYLNLIDDARERLSNADAPVLLQTNRVCSRRTACSLRTRPMSLVLELISSTRPDCNEQCYVVYTGSRLAKMERRQLADIIWVCPAAAP